MARWLYALIVARRVYKRLIFHRRQLFLVELRPQTEGGRIAYPDAIFHITAEDVRRAERVAVSA
ncbi:MAG: hypothetical protein AB7F96_16570 [Beijerinckiaceae bacterium]